MLPTAGTSSWKVKLQCHNVIIGLAVRSGRSPRSRALEVDEDADEDEDEGEDEDEEVPAVENCCWGLNVCTGRLQRYHQAPEGYPDGDERLILTDCAGNPTNLKQKANGALIAVVVDHDRGTLSFRINDGPVLEALTGFPAGAQLRPWAWCVGVDAGVSFEGALEASISHRTVHRRSARPCWQ